MLRSSTSNQPWRTCRRFSVGFGPSHASTVPYGGSRYFASIARAAFAVVNIRSVYDALPRPADGRTANSNASSVGLVIGTPSLSDHSGNRVSGFRQYSKRGTVDRLGDASAP